VGVSSAAKLTVSKDGPNIRAVDLLTIQLVIATSKLGWPSRS
jgi:hypothetical protein